jgi:putative ABC transport system substrate-binding protein
MNRRDFITLVGGAATVPRAAFAQQTAVPVLGFLNSGSPDTSAQPAAAFRQGLAESGFRNGRNVTLAADRHLRLANIPPDEERG